MDMLRQIVNWLMPLEESEESTTSLNNLLDDARRAQYTERYDEALSLLDEASQQAEEKRNTTAKVDIALTRGDILIAQKRYEEAQQWLTDLKNDVEGRQHRAPLAYTLCSLGQIALTRHQLDEAREYFDTARNIASEVSARAAEGRAAAHLGDTYLTENNASYAEYLLKDAVEMLEKSGDRELLGYFLARLGQAKSIMGRPDDGRETMQRGLDTAIALRHQPQVREIQAIIGDEAYQQADYARARKHYRKALNLIPDNSTVEDEYTDLRLKLGQTMLYLNAAQEALELAQKAFDEATASNQPGILQRAQAVMGMALHHTGQSADALPYLQQAVDATPDSQSTLQSDSLRTLAAAQAATGHPEQAEETYHQAIKTARENSPQAAQIYADLGDLYADQQQLSPALEQWQQALSAYSTLSHARPMARLYCQIADTQLLMDNPKQALSNYESAIAQISHVEDRDTRGYVLTQVAIAYTDYGRHIDTADEFFKEAIALAEGVTESADDTEDRNTPDETDTAETSADSDSDTATTDSTHPPADPRTQVIRRGHYGRFLALTGKPKKAITELMQARNQTTEHNLTTQQAILTAHLGLAYQALDDNDKALSLNTEALNAFENESAPQMGEWLATLHNQLGNIYATRNQLDEARAHYQQAQTHAIAPRRGQAVATALTGLARLDIDAGETDNAGDKLEAAYQQCKRSALRREMVAIYEQQSRLYSLKTETAKAKAAWKEASKLRAVLHMPASEATWL